ncbi:MAG: hypothetical protein O3A00_19275 [Planctomycetota bacterium]|nr:hypothetical protein [Planctomycetota bacterium]
MLLGELPDLRETQSGKDLIQIGRVEGVRDALLMLIGRKQQIDGSLRKRIESTNSVEELNEMLERFLDTDDVSTL